MARPKKNSELRSHKIGVRVSEEDYARIKKKAQQANKTISSYSRESLIKGEVIQVDKTKPQLLASLGRVGNNINQIALKVNQTGGIRLNEREYRIIEEMRNLLKQIADDIVK